MSWKSKPTEKSVNMGGRPWTYGEERLIALRLEKQRALGYMPTAAFWDELAAELGRTPRAIVSKVAKLRRAGVIP